MSSASTRPNTRRRRQQVFLTTGTFTVPAGVFDVDAFILGGGGGGSVYVGAQATVAGSSGGSQLRRRVAVTPGAALPVTVGGGGAPGSFTSSSGSQGYGAGVAGGPSSFGGFSAPGGAAPTANGAIPGAPTGLGSGQGSMPAVSQTANPYAPQQPTPGGDGLDGYGPGSGSVPIANQSYSYGAPGRNGQPALFNSALTPVAAPANTGAAGAPQNYAVGGVTATGQAGGSGLVILEWEE